jgi:hypothetical protein
MLTLAVTPIFIKFLNVHIIKNILILLEPNKGVSVPDVQSDDTSKSTYAVRLLKAPTEFDYPPLSTSKIP